MVYGWSADAYWIDIGTPERYLQGTFDILEGNVATSLAEPLEQARGTLTDGAEVRGRVVAPALVGPGSTVAESAIVGGRVVLGPGVAIGEGAHVESSVLLGGTTVGAGSVISSSIVGGQCVIGEHCHVEHGVVLGERVRVGNRNVLTAGAKVSPGVVLPDGAIRF